MAKWQIYLFTFCFRQLRKIASDIKCQHMKQGDEIWRLSVQFIGRRISFFFFLSMKFSNGGSHLWELYYILSWHGDPPMILPNIILTCFRQWFLACHTSESEKCPCPQSLCLKFQHGNAFCHRVVWSQTEDDSVSEKVQIMQVTMFVLMFAVCRAGRLPVPRCAFRRWKTYVFVWQNHPPQTRESRVLWAAHALLSPPTHLLTPRQSRGLFLSAWRPSKVSKPL